MDEGAPHTHWIDGRIVDDAPRFSGPAWAFVVAILALLAAVDLTLGWGVEDREQAPPAALDGSADVRAELEAAVAAADAGRPSFLLIGDSVLAGDVMAEDFPDWRSQRVVDHMRTELADHDEAELRQVALDALLPIDALHVLAELDRLDPGGEVTLVLELNLRYFSRSYAEQRECTRPQLCALAKAAVTDGGALIRAGAGILEASAAIRDALVRRTPIRRHRDQPPPNLAELDGLVVARAKPGDELDAELVRRAEGLARVQEHYRSATFEPGVQVEAITAIVERLRARGRPALLFFTPLDDAFVSTTMPGNGYGRRQELLTRLIHDHAGRGSNIRLLDLDHPLFGPDYFLDHVHLDPAGNRLLALNLLHELGLPLRARPPWTALIRGEDHDQTLVQRRGVGYADGGAWRALLRSPTGVAASRSGDWVVIADTGSHALRQLRGAMAIVERLAGVPGSRTAGYRDGPALEARFEQPRSPEIVDDEVYVLDGRRRERVRRIAGGEVQTLRWTGPRCSAYLELESRILAGRPWLFLACKDRVLAVDLGARRSAISLAPGSPVSRPRAIEPTDDGRLLVADAGSRIWSITLDEHGGGDEPVLVFANAGAALLPNERGAEYPFSFDQMRINRIVGMEWIDRYGLVLVQDEHDLGVAHERLKHEETERLHLRVLDLERELILPWIKAIPHAEAFHMWNTISDNLVSYFHFGAFAIVQDDASLIHVERERSRVLRLADGLLAAAKAGGIQHEQARVELRQPITSATASWVAATLRPDRFLATRHEPIPRRGPHVALLIGSPLSALSDRFGNYALGRLLELELGDELGIREGVRLDLFQRTLSTTSLERLADTLEDFVEDEGPPPDVVLLELHGRMLRDDRALDRIAALAERLDARVIFYDNTALSSVGRDGLRAPPDELAAVIEDARARDFTVLEPSDLLLRELLVESPWGNQPWSPGFEHGSTWAVELTARVLARLAYPEIREFLRARGGPR